MNENKLKQKSSYLEILNVSRWAIGNLYKIHPKFSVIYISTTIIEGLTGIVSTYIFAKILDQIINLIIVNNVNLQAIYPYIGGLLLLEIFERLIAYTREYSRLQIRHTLKYRTSQLLYEKLQLLGIETLENSDVQDKIDRAKDSLGNLINFSAEIIQMLNHTIRLLVYGYIIGVFLPIAIPLILAVLIPMFYFDKKIRIAGYRYEFANTKNVRKAKANADSLFNIRYLPEIFINKSYKFLNNKFLDFYTIFSSNLIKNQNYFNINELVFLFLERLVLLFAYLRIFEKLINKTITIGVGYFHINVLESFTNAFGELAHYFNEVSEHVIYFRDTYELFSMKPSFKDGTIKISTSNGPSVEFKNVSFHYPSHQRIVLDDVSLLIKKGEKVAIIGHNGAGKTTLIKLICRMYKVSNGEIKINNINVNDIKIKSLYDLIGILFQEFNLYPQLSVKENVMIGNPSKKSGENEVIQALEKADSTDFVNDYPDKLNQILGESYGGIRPSYGQWQKLAIARFFYRNAPLVIFDEPTASIDAMSEYKIFNQIYKFFKNKTVIIVSHRFSTVRNADRIVVLEHGKIIEQGSHEELIAKDGYYAKSFRLQAEGYS